MYWHGFSGTWDQFLDMPLSDRFLANAELSTLIDHVNEKGGGDRPKDTR